MWTEDKSSFLGSVGVLPALQRLICAAPTVELVASLDCRCARICVEYGGVALSELSADLNRVATRLGLTRTRQARRALRNGRIDVAVESLLAYYDAAYIRRAHRLRRERIDQATIDDDPIAVVAAVHTWIARPPLPPS